jgi:hypothetical protein
MHAPTITPEDPAAAERAAVRLARLDVLAEIGLGISRRLQREVQEAEVGALDLGAVSLAFCRLSKAVRQTIALQARLEADQALAARKAAEARPFWERAVQPRIPTPWDKAVSALDQAVAAEAGGDEAAYERLEKALDERLEAIEDDDDRPVGAIVAEICEALGIEPDWSLWQDEDWALEEALTKAPGSPYGQGRPEVAEGGAETVAGRAREALPP